MALLRGSSPVFPWKSEPVGRCSPHSVIWLSCKARLRPVAYRMTQLISLNLKALSAVTEALRKPRLTSRSESRSSQRSSPLRKHTAMRFRGGAPGGGVVSRVSAHRIFRPLMNPAGLPPACPTVRCRYHLLGQTLRRFSGLRFATSLCFKVFVGSTVPAGDFKAAAPAYHSSSMAGSASG